MENIILIDTNIYRQLGSKFYEHLDYTSLENYCYSSGSEIIVTQTVLSEYLDYYQKELVEKHTSDIEHAFDKLLKLDRFSKVRKPNLNKYAKAQIDFIKGKLTERKLKVKLDSLLNEADLLKFLVENKQESKKDNTRDYLIWLNVLTAAKRYSGNNIVLISEDKIFTENAHFAKLKAKHSIKRLEVYKSISSFLAVYGFKSDKLTKELILSKIPKNTIEREILKDKDSIPSHISHFYSDIKQKFKLEKFEIQDVKVEDFYSHKDLKAKEVKVIAHVQVKVNMVFSPEEDREGLSKFLETAKILDPYQMNTFDSELRPVYNDYILFHFLLTFSEETNQITGVKFLDFFPDSYSYKNMMQALR